MATSGRRLHDKQTEQEFIDLWRGSPCLYASDDIDYRDRQMKYAAVLSIAEHFGTTTDRVFQKISTLRTQYSKFIKIPRTGTGAKALTARQRWVLQSCAFLRDYVIQRPSLETEWIDSQENHPDDPDQATSIQPESKDDTDQESSQEIQTRSQKVRKSCRVTTGNMHSSVKSVDVSAQKSGENTHSKGNKQSKRTAPVTEVPLKDIQGKKRKTTAAVSNTNETVPCNKKDSGSVIKSKVNVSGPTVGDETDVQNTELDGLDGDMDNGDIVSQQSSEVEENCNKGEGVEDIFNPANKGISQRYKRRLSAQTERKSKPTRVTGMCPTPTEDSLYSQMSETLRHIARPDKPDTAKQTFCRGLCYDLDAIHDRRTLVKLKHDIRNLVYDIEMQCYPKTTTTYTNHTAAETTINMNQAAELNLSISNENKLPHTTTLTQGPFWQNSGPRFGANDTSGAGDVSFMSMLM